MKAKKRKKMKAKKRTKQRLKRSSLLQRN